MVIDAQPNRARVQDLIPNPWNPNVMSKETFEKELNSIREFGFIDPITVMPDDASDYYVIIDGEHRWKAALALGIEQVPIMVLFGVTKQQAKKLTPILNGLHGEADASKLSDLLRDLLSEETTESLLRTMPFTVEAFNDIAGIEPFDWDSFADKMSDGQPSNREAWVERTYRLPTSAAEVIDRSIARVRQSGEMPDWKALELICADFLA